jgi:signal transduction histidine kinase/ligand-binding sensor domain-containing protein
MQLVPMLCFPRFSTLWMLATLLLASGGHASTFLTEGYAVRVWQTEDGLPQNVVNAAVQTRDGYLWFATPSGLARFDGEGFRLFNSASTPELRDRRISRLYEDAEGTLWIGHETGTITRFRSNRFEIFAPPAEQDSEKVIGLGSDEDGRLWAMRENGAIDSLTDGRRIPSLLTTERPRIMAWTRNARGNIWVNENGQAARLTGDNLNPLPIEPPRWASGEDGVIAAADGGVWIFREGQIRKWHDGHWTEDRGKYPWSNDTIACGLELRDGTIAIGMIHTGLYLIFGDGRPPLRFDRSNGLPQEWVRFLYEDREGSLWAGTGSAGLVSIHPTAFSVLNAPDGWEGCSVLAVAPGRDGSLWIGSDGAGVYHYAAGVWTQYASREGLSNRYIWSVAESDEGEVWAGNFWWGSPYRLRDGKFYRPPNVDESWSPALALFPIPETGELLVGNRNGLLRLKDGEPSTWLIRSPEGTADDVTAVARDRDGVIWCGFAQGGLARLTDGEVTIFRRQDGLASDAVHCLFADEDGALWIGTADTGLSRYKNGQFANLGMAQGLVDNAICSFLDDGLGYFWMSSHHGIQRVAKDELNRLADGKIPHLTGQIYDRSDGLPVVEFAGGRHASACKTTDGRLWFASSKGILSVDPQRIRTNPLPPPVVLESLVVDGVEWPSAQGKHPTRLQPGHERLEFHFSGLSYVSPRKVQFKYRLEGIDNTWVDAGSRRTAFYSRLPAGAYRFHVIAANNDGLWNADGASFGFTVAPFFWQTGWFLASCLVLAAGGVGWLARYLTQRRLHRQMEAMERLHAIELERARIAQDIHDDVGASLSRIAMLSQPARSQLAEPERAAAVLTRIYSTAREVTRSLDEIVWAVDPRHDTLDSLVDYMGRFAQDLLGTANIRCRLDLPVQVPAWPLTAETRHNLFLAFKEALNNAIKHAAATEVRITLNLHEDEFSLVIRDNGRGFVGTEGAPRDPDRLNSGNGLSNMNQRLTRIHGRCELTSVPGAGTSVSFTVGVARTQRAAPAAP